MRTSLFLSETPTEPLQRRARRVQGVFTVKLISSISGWTASCLPPPGRTCLLESAPPYFWAVWQHQSGLRIRVPAPPPPSLSKYLVITWCPLQAAKVFTTVSPSLYQLGLLFLLRGQRRQPLLSPWQPCVHGEAAGSERPSESWGEGPFLTKISPHFPSFQRRCLIVSFFCYVSM